MQKNINYIIMSVILSGIFAIPEIKMEECELGQSEQCKKTNEMIKILNSYIEEEYGHNANIHYKHYAD